ncbi:MAG: hypothetical protein KAI50_11710 [Desulfobacterales bacterium]|nr:hypothetical protein [Desulfobacterales bacterium]
MKKNPFYLKEIPVDAPFCDREKELADLISYAKSNTTWALKISDPLMCRESL